jgi:integrase
MRLTDKAVAALPTPAKGNRLHYDDQVKGLAARVTAAGGRAFVLSYRVGGRERRATIGGFPEWTIGAAREQAKRWKRDVDLGVDPLAERETARAADDALFRPLAERFLAHGRTKRGRLLRPATTKEYRRALLTYAAPLHGQAVADVHRRDVAAVLAETKANRGAVTAMRTRAALSRFYTWLIANGDVEHNPVAGTEGYETGRRSRVFSETELRVIWAATAASSDFNLIVRLMLWTGCRRAEAGGMADSELADGRWTVPAERTKNHRPLVLPLPRQALEALAVWPRVEKRDLLFGRGGRGFQGWSHAKARLDRATGLERAWDLHDARRTVETRLAAIGVRKEIANRVLNHAAGPITETYDLHDYLKPKAIALQRWADALDQITGAAPANVLPLRRSGS